MRKIEIYGLEGIPEIKPGDDLSEIIIEAVEKNGLTIKDDDIFVIAQKIVSKSENRIVDLNDVIPSEESIKIAKITDKDPRLVELILRESKRIVKLSKGHIIVETKHGLVCANAGIDKSNVGNVEEIDKVLLLPDDPDISAKRIKEAIEKKTGARIGVIISDTYGRMLREGQINYAIGASGVRIFRDYRNKKDRYGYVLQVKNIAEAEEVACAAELVIGQADESIPVALVRGLKCEETTLNAKALNMPEEKWLFK
ncbi:MAG TPA: coenzyme F420-0:L-glutamate ligase [Geobacterales bacterium]|nr:coenzyme F420-0:L-glutamate ligase [Geobacterales bacterium]